jgi:multidrug resistance protein
MNPLHWATSKKWLNVTLIVMQAILSPIASTILAIGAAEIADEFELTSAKLPVFPTAFYVLGIGTGPLVLAPCSELYGKRIIYLCSFGCFTILNVGCALSPNIATLTILRFLSGVVGSAGPSLSSGSIGDMFTIAERGRAQAVASFGPVFGPVLGGVIGGFIVYHTSGWRWLLWTVAIAAGITSFLSACFLGETYGPFILAQKAARLNKTSSRTQFYVHQEALLGNILIKSITRPVRLLFTSPILGFMALYQSL